MSDIFGEIRGLLSRDEDCFCKWESLMELLHEAKEKDYLEHAVIPYVLGQLKTSKLFRYNCRPLRFDRKDISPLFLVCTDIYLSRGVFTDEDAIALANCPYMINAFTLCLRADHITEKGVLALAASPHLRRVQTMGIFHSQLEKGSKSELAIRNMLTNNARVRI